MNRPARKLIQSTIALAILAGCLAWLRHSPAKDAGGETTVLAESGELRWRKGNLHTHTHWSDGDEYLENVGLWYKDRGYDFLCITDHNTIDEIERWVEPEKARGKLTAFEKLQANFPKDWIVERTTDGKREVRLKMFSEVAARLDEPGKFLMLRGEEISDAFQKRPIHMNVTNIQEAIPPLGGENVTDTIQRNFDAVQAQRERTGQPMLVHLNHPNFVWGVTAEDLMRVRGENFFEVYNGHPSVHNTGDKQHANTERIWDVINAFRLTELELPLMYGLGTDDGHNYHKYAVGQSNPGRAWVVVLTADLSPEAIIAAMEAGRFYASNGVALERIESSRSHLSLKVKPEDGVTYKIEFIGTKKGFDPQSAPVLDKDGKPLDGVTRRYSADIGAVLKTVEGAIGEYRFAGDELYVRARITSSKPHPNPSEPGDFEQAWVQPVVPSGASR
jgi:hypothetical protein